MARYPQAMLAACPTAWDDNEQLVEDIFRREVQMVLAAGFNHLYVFGTGSEGYAVDTPRFTQVARVFHEETSGPDVHPMIGVIGLSTAQIVERIRIAYDIGFRTFQISLPSWGVLTDDEVLRFFVDTCGTFPDAQFLNYNLPRVKRVLSGSDYARIIPKVRNLVATKTTSGGLTGAEELLRNAPELMHFMGEGNFPHGSMFGEVGLLATMAELTPGRVKEIFEAGRTRDIKTLFQLQHDFVRMEADLWGVGSDVPHMDGAYDKMLTKLGLIPEFPLRLLSPYVSFGEEDYRAMRRLLDDKYADWMR
jgi:dihydrodipicolinate synthase/N-acetylneuraminate lyase